MNLLKLRLLLEQFFIEDIGERDVTTDLIFNEEAEGEIVFIAKEKGIFSGADIIQIGFTLLDSKASISMYVNDGDPVEKGQQIATVKGQVRSLLKGERVILNLLQRMSGISTSTFEAVKLLNSKRTKITDTRKTTPGLRMLEKYAVRCGGGFNHRYGLYDAVLIKDNHIAFAGTITKAVEAVRDQLGHMVKIEVETETKKQVLEAVKANVDCIMFDNRNREEINELAALVPDHITTEVSGGLRLQDLPQYSNLNIDYISLGCLTHSISSLDISVKVLVK